MLVYQRVAIKVWTHCRSSALKVWCTFRGRNWNTFSGKTFKAIPTCRLYNGIRHFLKIMKHRWKKFRTAWLLFCFGHVWSNIWPLPMCDIGWKIRYNKHFLKSKDSSDLWCCISWPSEAFGVISSGKCCTKNGNVLSSIGTQPCEDTKKQRASLCQIESLPGSIYFTSSQMDFQPLIMIWGNQHPLTIIKQLFLPLIWR